FDRFPLACHVKRPRSRTVDGCLEMARWMNASVPTPPPATSAITTAVSMRKRFTQAPICGWATTTDAALEGRARQLDTAQRIIDRLMYGAIPTLLRSLIDNDGRASQSTVRQRPHRPCDSGHHICSGHD